MRRPPVARAVAAPLRQLLISRAVSSVGRVRLWDAGRKVILNVQIRDHISFVFYLTKILGKFGDVFFESAELEVRQGLRGCSLFRAGYELG